MKSCKNLSASYPSISLENFITKSTIEIDLKPNKSMAYLSNTEEAMKLKIADFQLGRSLGEGKFGDVYFCKHKLTQSVYALKKIFKSTIK